MVSRTDLETVGGGQEAEAGAMMTAVGLMESALCAHNEPVAGHQQLVKAGKLGNSA